MTDLNVAPDVGSQLGRYTFLREVARGPLGPLFELHGGVDTQGLSGLGRVISLPSDLDADTGQAIATAAWESLEIKNERALCVADVVFGNGWVTLVHDYAEGSLVHSLRKRAEERNSKFPVSVALRVVIDMIEGLESHRVACDSAGLAWTPGGIGSGSLYLCGNGRARLLDGQVMFALFREGGKRVRADDFPCSAPELYTPVTKVDERADVFAAGAALWELLTGIELSEAKLVKQTHSLGRVPKLSQAIAGHGANLPVGLIRAVDTALELIPSRRQPSLANLKAALCRDSEIASYEQVIEFTDALLNRESTLFRLTLDPTPKLSDELRGVKPLAAHEEWTLKLAKNARMRGASGSSGELPANAVSSRLQHPTTTTRAPSPEPISPKVPPRLPSSATARQSQASSVRHTLVGLSPAAYAPQSPALAHNAQVALPELIAQASAQPDVASQIMLVASGDPIPECAPVAPEIAPEIAPEPPASTATQRPTDSGTSQRLPATTQALSPLREAAENPQSHEDEIVPRSSSKASIRLTPVAAITWLLAAVTVTVIATLSLQRVFTNSKPTATSIPSSTSIALAQVASAASSENTITQPPPQPSSEPATPPAEVKEVSAPAENPAPSQIPASAPANPPAPSVSSVAPRTVVAPPANRLPSQQGTRKKKRLYVPHGL